MLLSVAQRVLAMLSPPAATVEAATIAAGAQVDTAILQASVEIASSQRTRVATIDDVVATAKALKRSLE